MSRSLEPQRHIMHILAVHQLEGNVFQVMLQAADYKPLIFHAGQYLMLHRPGLPDCAYSIASSPVPQTHTLELHVQCHQDSQVATEVIHYLKSHTEVEVSLPFGQCTLQAETIPKAPLVFIAAATGLSQMKSLIEFTATTQHAFPCFFYWGAIEPNGFYMPHLPAQWARKQLVEYHPVVSGSHDTFEWNGRFGLLYEAVLEDCDRFRNAHFYIGGSPAMVYATVDALLAAGFSEGVMHSDVFEYAPRQ